MSDDFTVEELIEGFEDLTIDTIEVLSGMVKDLNEKGLTDSTTTEVDIVVSFAKQYGGEKLITSFLKNNEHWGRILDRDIVFFVEDVPKLFKEMPIDLSVLIVPVSLYLNHKKSEKKIEGYPHDEGDIESLWEYFEQLIKCSVRYNNKLNAGRFQLQNKKKIDKLFTD